MVKAFRCLFQEDFGKEWHIIVCENGKWCLFQAIFSINDDAGTPYLQISLGAGHLIEILGWIGKFGFEFSAFSKVYRG